MFSRLTRILMALVTAFVFTGQMEAAAEHCARLAKAAAIEAPVIEASAIVATAEQTDAPCHESKAAAADMHAAMNHDHTLMDHAAPDHSGHAKSPPHCECIAALSGWVDLDGATTSTLVEAYAWLVASETSFASATPDPDLRPPRA